MLPRGGLSRAPAARPGAAPFAIALLLPSAALCGVFVGVLSGLASRQLHVIGLWELAAAWSLALLGVGAAHLLQVRSRRALLVAAIIAALAWLSGHHGADAWAFRGEQIRAVSGAGLLMADQAVLHDTDDPEALVDFSLMGETGKGGVVGAARVLLRRGLTVHRVGNISRIIPIPSWLHALFYGLQAAFVALVIGRATAQLMTEPVCPRCGVFLRRQPIGWVTADAAKALIGQWAGGRRAAPQPLETPQSSKSRPDGALAATRNSCPRGCTTAPGYSLLRRRGMGFSSSAPGTVANLEAVVAEPEAAEDVSAS